jgi:hypothetical protein
MTQGRKCKTVLASTLAMLVALVAMASLAPALAVGQAAGDEYDLDDLPSANGNAGGDQSSQPDTQSGSSESGQGASVAAPSGGGGGGGPTAGQTQTAGGGGGASTAGGGGSTGDGGSTGSNGASSESGGASPTPTEPQSGPELTAGGSSDDGGAPILLIVLAIVAAVCTGLAIWRLRRRDETEPDQAGDGEGVGREPGGPTGVTESQST